MTDFKVVIPARYASSRLPAKALVDIVGKPMIQHVYERACESGASEVIIATDDARIETVALGFNAQVCMTSPHHASGTDRVAEVVAKQAWQAEQIVVNLQGDEPLISPKLLQQVADALAAHPQAQVATLCAAITDVKTCFNANNVKVVRDKQGYALYFSRAPIPWHRDSFADVNHAQLPSSRAFIHIGLYAYRAAYCQHITQIPPCDVELDEALEQLRILYQGDRIYVAEACAAAGIGVDTEADLANVRALMQNRIING